MRTDMHSYTGINFKDSQREAVEARNTNVLVFASAGGGKTAVLVERLLQRIIDDRIPLDEILAMTFTNAAARNMKIRLEKALVSCLKENDDPFLKRQLSLIETAKITTIHSFCLSLIKEYYYLLGIRKSRIENTLADSQRKLLLEESFREVISSCPHLNDLSRSLSGEMFSVDTLERVLNSIFTKAVNHYDPLRWIEEHRAYEISSFEELPEESRFYYFRELKAQLKLCQNVIEEIVRLSDDDNYKKILAQMPDLIEEEDYQQLLFKIGNVFTNLPTLPKKKYGEELYGILNPLRDKLTKTILPNRIAAKLIPLKTLINDHNASVPFVNELLDLTKEYYLTYQRKKEEADAIDFNDYEHFAYELLCLNDGALAEKLRNKFREIMIDEFQDTNDTQYKIASLLENRDLFVVGDVKQSIYRFRNARPAIMESLKKDDSFHTVHIRHNHRSKENIISFNNVLFDRIMNLFGIFDENDAQETGTPEQKEGGGKIEILIGDGPDKYEIVTDQILKLHEEGTAFRDMAVLVRTHDLKTALKYHFEHYHIPYYLEERSGYFASSSLEIIEAFLKYLMDREDRIAKVSLLTSPIYRLSDNDLMAIRDDGFDYGPLNRDIGELEKLLKKNDLVSLLRYILSIDHYFDDLPIQEKSNIDLFLRDFRTYPIHSLYDLICFIEEGRNSDSTNAASISESADVVKVMTMHGSKGLEFKTVFLISESRNMGKESSDPVLVDAELGLGVRNMITRYRDVRPVFNRLAIEGKANFEDLLEYQRLFYVACTRAKENLYIVDDAKVDIQDFNETLVYARKGFTNYVLPLINELPAEIHMVTELGKHTPLTKKEREYQPLPVSKYSLEERKTFKPSSHGKTLLFYKEQVDFGLNVHAYFEDLDFSLPLNIPEIKERFPERYREVIPAVKAFLEDELTEKMRSFEIIKELEFTSYEEEGTIHGFMDLVAVSDEVIYLIDYKTNHSVTEEELISLYTPQLSTYKKALQRVYKQPVRAYLYSTYLKKYIPISFPD